MLKAAFADQDFLAKLSSFVFRGCNISLPAADLNVTFFGNLTIVEHEKNDFKLTKDIATKNKQKRGRLASLPSLLFQRGQYFSGILNPLIR